MRSTATVNPNPNPNPKPDPDPNPDPGPNLGEYNHVLTIFLVTRYFVAAHALACLLFVVLGGCLATLNHTRRAMSETSPGWPGCQHGPTG